MAMPDFEALSVPRMQMVNVSDLRNRIKKKFIVIS